MFNNLFPLNKNTFPQWLKSVFVVCLFLSCFSISLFSEDFYWEDQKFITSSDTRFPTSATSPISAKKQFSIVTWQDIVPSSESQNGSIYLSSYVSGNDNNWELNKRFAGPFNYAGEVPNIHSVAINSSGVISVAVLSDTQQISVYSSRDGGKSYSTYSFPPAQTSLVAPRIYRTSVGGFIIFATEGKNESFSLLYSQSPDGFSWSSFEPFLPAQSMTNAFVPMLCDFENSDLVVFQSSYSSGNRLSYQLYSTISTDGATTWSAAKLITDKNIPSSTYDSSVFSNFHNQRPFIYLYNNTPYLSWERSYYSSENAQIYIAELTKDGVITGIPTQITATGDGKQPVLFSSNNILSALWFDNRRGVETVYMAQRNGILWDEQRISTSNRPASFSLPVLVPSLANPGNYDLHIFWQQTQQDGTGRISCLSPDRSVSVANIQPQSFTVGKKSTSSKVSAKVVMPNDSSGIAGYSWIWTQNQYEDPPATFMRLASQPDLSLVAQNDGPWYLKVRVLDYAGNWSKSTSLTYVRDTTPPAAPIIENPLVDSFGMLSSNTFSMSWEPGLKNYVIDDDIAGYTWSLEYLSIIPNNLVHTEKRPLVIEPEIAEKEVSDLLSSPRIPARPPARIQGTGTAARYNNRDNGLYAFSVSAIDNIGNISQPTVLYFVLNKYIPYTMISAVDSKTDDFGTLALSIYGRGFLYDGTISTVYIDKDGKAPYDIILTSETNGFRINSDSRISGISLADVEEGNYRIGLLHTDRGLYFSGRILSITEYGTVKKGNYNYRYVPLWTPISQIYRYSFQFGDVVLWGIFVFAIAGLVVAIRGIVHTTKDSIAVRHEIQALITGDVMPLAQKKKKGELQIRGIGLRFKLVFFTTFLIIMVILLVSIPLGLQMIKTQEQTLTQGLKERVDVLLEGLSAGVKAYLPAQNILELGFLPQQTNAMEEAKFATITGLAASENNTSIDYIWATNDGDIANKIDSETLSYGNSRLVESHTETINQMCATLNEKAVSVVGEMTNTISTLTAEGISLATRTDAISVERRNEIQTITRQLNEKLTAELTKLSQEGAGSWPQYDNLQLNRENTTYIFYKPVLYRQGSEQTYVRSVIQVEVSTENLVVAVDNARRNILFTTAFIAFLAIGIGALCSLVLAAVIIRPIRFLATHVAMIRDTEDKEELAGKDIKIKSKDEIGLLGETVNDMTHGLVKAAAASKDLTVGKEVQKMFIPLEVDSAGKKLTTGTLDDPKVQFFGYYEGAKGVSGDYFDYKKLDDKWYAIIKCDVSGKGVPAALIMVEVATLFLNYFKDWSLKKDGTNLSPIVSQINDLIESRGFKGRFAAFTLCLFNSDTGMLYFCNAGDNLIHYYDASERKKKTVTLPESAAAGVFPSFMVDMKGGFKVSTMKLNPGDVLFLYTDGIEEAKRMFRDENFKNIVCAEPDLPPESPHGYHTVGQESEEMAPERVNAIIEAVFSRSIYKLEKYHNPIKDEVLEFDFSSCEGTAEDAIIALVSVEKIFRMYPDPSATEFDRVLVDRKIDAFLSTHFRQYERYCSNQKNNTEAPEYLYYTNMKEDSQYDDLTLIALKKR